MTKLHYVTLLALLSIGLGLSVAVAQPGPGPGPGGGGPPDPPRDTPGLDPVTLGLIATGGYAGYQYLRNKPGKS